MRFNDSSSVFAPNAIPQKVLSLNSRQFSFASSKCGSICLILAVRVYFFCSFVSHFLFCVFILATALARILRHVCCYPSKLPHLILFWILFFAILAFIVLPFCYRLFKDDAAKTFAQSKDFFLRSSTKLLEIVFNDILTSPASIQVFHSHENMYFQFTSFLVLNLFA